MNMSSDFIRKITPEVAEKLNDYVKNWVLMSIIEQFKEYCPDTSQG